MSNEQTKRVSKRISLSKQKKKSAIVVIEPPRPEKRIATKKQIIIKKRKYSDTEESEKLSLSSSEFTDSSELDIKNTKNDDINKLNYMKSQIKYGVRYDFEKVVKAHQKYSEQLNWMKILRNRYPAIKNSLMKYYVETYPDSDGMYLLFQQLQDKAKPRFISMVDILSEVEWLDAHIYDRDIREPPSYTYVNIFFCDMMNRVELTSKLKEIIDNFEKQSKGLESWNQRECWNIYIPEIVSIVNKNFSTIFPEKSTYAQAESERLKNTIFQKKNKKVDDDCDD
jgi:hypothetical protein